jgi:hypothetical protein
MKHSFIKIVFGLIATAGSVMLYAQAEPAATSAVTNNSVTDDRMMTPPTVSGQTYATAGTAESRSNYLRGGVSFSAAYSDNVQGGASAQPVSDLTYSIWPTIAIDQTTPRLSWSGSYSPGYTFYQKSTGSNQANQNAGLSLQYRLSQHVTLSVHDSLSKSSNVFDQPTPEAPISGTPSSPPQTVIAPLADTLTNTAFAGISYQFGPSSMVGANGNFSNLHYLNSSQVPGLNDSSSQSGSVFYNRRLSRRHYLGAIYQYQHLLAYPSGQQNLTQTHSISAFYTLYVTPTLSFSVSGGPQYAETVEAPFPTAKSWTPSVTGSFGWQAKHTAISGSYSHAVSAGGGLGGAVHLDNGSLGLQQQITPHLSGGVSANYSDTKMLTPFFGNTAGHSISGTASLQRQFGQHFSLSGGYSRLHQSYGDIPLIAINPNTNREFVSISYNFIRPIGR